MAATGANMLYKLAPWQKPETRASVLHNNDAAVPWNDSMSASTERMTQRPVLNGIRNVRDDVFNVLSGIGLVVGGAINTGIDIVTTPLDVATNAAHAAMNVKQLLDRGNLIANDLVTKGVMGVSSTTNSVRNKLKGAVGWLFGTEAPIGKPELTLAEDTADEADKVLKEEEAPEKELADAA